MDVVGAAVVEEGVPPVLGGGAHVAGLAPGVVTHQHPRHEHGADRRGVPGVVVGVAGVPGKVTAWGWGERGDRGGERGDRGGDRGKEREEKKEERRRKSDKIREKR